MQAFSRSICKFLFFLPVGSLCAVCGLSECVVVWIYPWAVVLRVQSVKYFHNSEACLRGEF